MPPEVLIAGRIVKDRTQAGWRPGGGALYAAAQAVRLGLKTAVVTACHADIDPSRLVPEATWKVAYQAETEFENIYVKGRRSQRVSHTGRPLSLDDIPHDWRTAQTVLLAPVFHDVDVALPAQLKPSCGLLGLAVQGWLRRLEGDSVQPGAVDANAIWLKGGDVILVSEEDVDEPESVARWREQAPLVVLTRGENGCTVWNDSGRRDFAPVPSREMDPTGAGDVFATAFLVRFNETSDAGEAARFGSAAAALAIRGKGPGSVAGRAQIDARLANDAVIGAG